MSSRRGVPPDRVVHCRTRRRHLARPRALSPPWLRSYGVAGYEGGSVMPEPQWDAVIVGAGHNGLVAAWYLAHAGLRVLVLERREIVGGAVVTEELWPGYSVPTCSYICYVLQARVIDDMNLPA